MPVNDTVEIDIVNVYRYFFRQVLGKLNFQINFAKDEYPKSVYALVMYMGYLCIPPPSLACLYTPFHLPIFYH